MAVGSINWTNYSIILTVPPDSDVTQLVPTIGLSQYATVSPASGARKILQILSFILSLLKMDLSKIILLP